MRFFIFNYSTKVQKNVYKMNNFTSRDFGIEKRAGFSGNFGTGNPGNREPSNDQSLEGKMTQSRISWSDCRKPIAVWRVCHDFPYSIQLCAKIRLEFGMEFNSISTFPHRTNISLLWKAKKEW